MTNFIYVFLVQKNGIYWRFDNYILSKMQNQSEVVKSQLMGNLFIFINSNLYKFALLKQTSGIKILNI